MGQDLEQLGTSELAQRQGQEQEHGLDRLALASQRQVHHVERDAVQLLEDRAKMGLVGRLDSPSRPAARRCRGTGAGPPANRGGRRPRGSVSRSRWPRPPPRAECPGRPESPGCHPARTVRRFPANASRSRAEDGPGPSATSPSTKSDLKLGSVDLIEHPKVLTPRTAPLRDDRQVDGSSLRLGNDRARVIRGPGRGFQSERGQIVPKFDKWRERIDMNVSTFSRDARSSR